MNEAARIKTELLAVVKAQSCSLHPRALHLLVRAGAVISAPDERAAFLRAAVSSARLKNREINEDAARQSVSALLPSLQSEGVLMGSELADMQAILTDAPTATAGSTGTANAPTATNAAAAAATAAAASSAAVNAAAALFAAQNPNFVAVALESMPVVCIDESTCASFRVVGAPRAADIRRIADLAEKTRADPNSNNVAATGGIVAAVGGGSQQGSTEALVAAALSGNQSAAASLAATIDKRAEPSARMRALRTRVAIATSKVLRSPLFAANSLLGGGVSGARSLTGRDGAASASAGGGGGGNSKHTVYRISALDGIQLGAPITLVGLLRFAPWLVTEPVQQQANAAAAQHQQQMKQQNGAGAGAAAAAPVYSRTGWLLEDFSGQLPILLPADAASLLSVCSNALIGDGTAAVVHGLWSGTCIRAQSITLPPGETRAHAHSCVGASDDFFGARPADMHAAARAFTENGDKNVAILVSDIQLNVPSNAAKLLGLIRAFEDRSGEVDLAKVTFILVGDFIASGANSNTTNAAAGGGGTGNYPAFSTASCAALDCSFQTRGGGGSDRNHGSLCVADSIAHLGKEPYQRHDTMTPATVLTATLRDFAQQLQQQCPQVAALSEFILVPGPNDCCGSPVGFFPRAPLHSLAVAAFRERCPRAVGATNPCRLRFHTQEYVLCRAPLQRTFAASALSTIEGKSVAEQQEQQRQQQANNRLVRKKGGALHAVHSVGDDDGDGGDGDDAAENAGSSKKREPFVDLAEAVVRGGFWFPVPSEGVLSAQTATAQAKIAHTTGGVGNRLAATTTSSAAAAGAAEDANQQLHRHSPALLRSWGNIRWAQDRALFHGGAPTPPHVSLVCDDTACWSCRVDDVVCANTGSFSQTGIFAWISPGDRTIDFNQTE